HLCLTIFFVASRNRSNMSEFIRMSRPSSFLQVLSNDFATFRLQDVFCDVTICCRGSYFLAHRIILSAFSNYFKEILMQAHCKHPFIVLQDGDAEDLEALLNFIYMGEIGLKNERIQPFLKMAEKLQVKGFTSSFKFETEPNYSPPPSGFYITTESAEEVPSRKAKRKREGDSLPTKSFKPNLPMRIEEQLQGPLINSDDDFQMTEDSKDIETSSFVFEESANFYPDSPDIVEISPFPNNEMIPENISLTDKNYSTYGGSDEFFFEDDFPDHHSRFSVSQEPGSETFQFCTPNNKQKKLTCDDIEPDNRNLETSYPSEDAENENEEYVEF
ncbi:Broad-complex core protein, partial [Armadillidium nasatum]